MENLFQSIALFPIDIAKEAILKCGGILHNEIDRGPQVMEDGGHRLRHNLAGPVPLAGM